MAFELRKPNGLDLSEEADRSLESLKWTHFSHAETSTATDLSLRLSQITLLKVQCLCNISCLILSLELTTLMQYISYRLAWVSVFLCLCWRRTEHELDSLESKPHGDSFADSGLESEYCLVCMRCSNSFSGRHEWLKKGTMNRFNRKWRMLKRSNQ